MNFVKRMWAWLTNGELVWLKDHDGEVTLAISYKTPFGDRIASRYWPVNSVLVLLKEDGTTAGTHYVERWMPANKQ